jgi:DNA repair protein RecN (Recombination protein N)
MLLALEIQDFVIVERLRLEFAEGFGVFTGETGAGKSILVDALLLVLGARADAGVVRAGHDRADIAAEFDIAGLPEVERLLADLDLSGDVGLCLLRRVVEAGGRSRAYVNGRPATAAQLREIGEHLVDIHGQHEHQSLMRSPEQRRLLDDFAGAGEAASMVAAACRDWRAALETLAHAEARAATAADERDRLEWQAGELRQLGLGADEWPQLQADHGRLAHAAALIEGAEVTLETLSEGEGACLAVVSAAVSRLGQLAGHDPALAEILEPAEIHLKEAAHALRHYRQRLDLDPERLRETESRLEVVVSMARKHRVAPEALPGRLAELEDQLERLAAATDAAVLGRALAAARAEYDVRAASLSRLRQLGAARLSKEVTATMESLAMTGGRFEVALIPLSEPSPGGAEQVEFRMTGHEGGVLAAVARAASGGELARLSLAIQTVTRRVAPVPTLVFDEVDAGIGGGVAEIVGRMLRALGQGRQTLCITHLPQVAAAADHHWRVAKRTEQGLTRSTVEALDAGARIEEVARMLGGVRITEATLAHAAEMLATHVSGGQSVVEDR